MPKQVREVQVADKPVEFTTPPPFHNENSVLSKANYKQVGEIMIYLTGDTHGNFDRIKRFCEMNNSTKDDVLIILGDAGINYYLNKRDYKLKQELQDLPITLFCIHGNHEERPENIGTYKLNVLFDNLVYQEPEFPDLKFAIDGLIYNIKGKDCLVLGGAYSVDKWYRLQMGWQWFESEQISDMRKLEIEDYLTVRKFKTDYVFSHTCPYNTRPVHMFLKSIDQSTVDSSMEVWLQKIADRLTFKHWYFGHYHDDWDNGKYSMLYTDIIPLGYKGDE